MTKTEIKKLTMIKIQIVQDKIFETTITNLLPDTQLSCTWCILPPLLEEENLQSVQGENVISDDSSPKVSNVHRSANLTSMFLHLYLVSSHLLSREVEGGLAVVAIHFQVRSHLVDKQRFI